MRTPGRHDGDEAELIDRSRKGDSEAFGVLVERYQRRVVGVALAVVHNQDDAIELAQETFIRAFENLAKFESRSSFSTWLYRIAANLAIDFWRREGRHVVLHGEDAENEIGKMPTSQGDSFKEVSRSELSARLKQALEELTPEHRAVILLREVEGMSYDEISDVLQCPRGTVMSRLHYARTHLRNILKDVSGS
ncbi:MAG: sigma-70 family RNA polymerase sigma factor [Candidatus Binatus sp.]|uniref:RNA polymerase sigma factor n=1 Tax=Candidatus Binatus sp. TaxID=2811406 RepID=UPI003CB3C25F